MSKFDKNRTIRVCGSITDEAYGSFSEELSRFEQANNKPVFIELCSDGGVADAALAFYSRIKKSSLTVHIFVMGHAESSASLILAAGDVRYMDSQAWVMVHESSDEFSGSTTALTKRAKIMQKQESQWSNLMAENTNKDKFFWLEKHKEVTYFNAEECLKLGLIEKIIK